jgi:hypothetical protein
VLICCITFTRRWDRGESSHFFPGRLALRFYRNNFRRIATKLRLGAPQIEHHALVSDLEGRKLDWGVGIEFGWSRESNDVFGHGHTYNSIVAQKGDSESNGRNEGLGDCTMFL